MEFKFVVWSTGIIWLKFKNHLVPHFYRLWYWENKTQASSRLTLNMISVGWAM